MACCLIALLLLAQCMATLRRWGAFWGLAPVPAGIEYDTVYVRARRWMGRRDVRIGIAAVVAVELGLLGSWLYVDHGRHIAMIVADGWQRLTGHQVVYAGTCDAAGNPSQVRLVLDTKQSGLPLFN